MPFIPFFFVKIAIFLSQRLDLDGSTCGGDAHSGAVVVLREHYANVACTFPDFLAPAGPLLGERTIIPDEH